MGKFLDGQNLTENEVRYLDLTSDFTHLLIDKSYYQSMVNIISRETIMKIESDLIDQILDNYYEIRNFVEGHRNEWLKARRKKSREKRDNMIDIIFEENINFVRKKLELKKWLKINVAKAKKRHKQLIRNTKKYCNKRNVTIKDVKDYIKSKKEKERHEFSFFVKKKRDSKRNRVKEFMKRSVPNMLKTELYGLIEEKKLRRKVYPVSKVLIDLNRYSHVQDDVII